MRRFAACLLVALSCGIPARADWKSDADARIEKHRKGDFVLTFTNADGKPLPDVSVAIEQTEVAFHFGTAVNGWLLPSARPAAAGPATTPAAGSATLPARPARGRSVSERNRAAYLGFVASHFNTLVSEDDMKWYSTEKEAGKPTFDRADALVTFAADHGLSVRGHCLFWSKQKYVHRQPWVETLSNEDLQVAIDRHLEQIVGRYRGRVFCWDVNNEMLDGAWYKDKLGPDIRAHMFTKAHEIDPDARLFINEYAILTSDAKTDRLIALVKELQAQGAPVGGIGIQEHVAERFAPAASPEPPDKDHPERQNSMESVDFEAVYRRLDRIAALGLPIELTEVSFKTADENRRADAVENFYRLMFSHPKVDAILLWGFWANAHFLGPQAALVDRTWRLLPAGQRYEQLVLKDWRTNAAAKADAKGTVRFRGFYGTYNLRVSDPATKRAGWVTVELPPGRPAATVSVTLR